MRWMASMTLVEQRNVSRVRFDLFFTAFSPLSIDDVISAVRQVIGRRSDTTKVLKQVADLTAPLIVKLFNCWLSTGHFPSARGLSLRLSRSRVYATNVSSYHLIWKWLVLSKFLEAAVPCGSPSTELYMYLTTADLLPTLYSLVFERAIRPKPPCCVGCRIVFNTYLNKGKKSRTMGSFFNIRQLRQICQWASEWSHLVHRTFVYSDRRT